MNFTKPMLALALFLAAPLVARAQGGEGVNPEEIARQIRRNMIKVEENLLKIDGRNTQKEAEAVANDLEKLIDGAKNRGQQITQDIDSLIESFKSKGQGQGQGQSKGKSGKSQDQQQGKKDGSQSRARDRNQPKGGEKPQGGEQSKSDEKKGGSQEKNQGQDPSGGRNRPNPRRPRDESEKVEHKRIEARWGELPPEMRQRLVDRNFQDFTPEYEREIRAYFEKISKRQ